MFLCTVPGCALGTDVKGRPGMAVTLFNQGQIFSNLDNVLLNECAYVKVYSLVQLLPAFQYCIAYSKDKR